MTNIYVGAGQTWDFFCDNHEQLEKEMVMIAENEDTEYAVYLTDDCGQPLFVVCKGDNPPERTELATDHFDCVETAELIYANYLFPVVISNDDTDDHSDMEDAQYIREDELRLGLEDFLAVVMQVEDNSAVEDELGTITIGSLMDEILCLIASYDICIYCPSFVVDEESGEEIFEEYPYN